MVFCLNELFKKKNMRRVRTCLIPVNIENIILVFSQFPHCFMNLMLFYVFRIFQIKKSGKQMYFSCFSKNKNCY